MNLQRREEIKVIAECPNDRHWAQEMRRAVADLLAHIDTLERTAAERVIADGKARAVVVPELPKFNPAWELSYRGKVASEKEQQAFANGYQFAMHKAEEALKNACAIPADRVLGEGMVGVDREALLGVLAVISQREETFCLGESELKDRNAIREALRLDALRANQGGAAT